VIVLDTNVLSETFRADASPLVIEYVATTRDLAITATSAFELLEGARRLPGGRRRRDILEAIELVLGSFSSRVLPYSGATARLQAGIAASRRAAGRPIDMEDGIIAATCLEHGATLATGNTRDFEGLGIEFLNPWEPRSRS
jgi:predicted nucleic acid-binding protein